MPEKMEEKETEFVRQSDAHFVRQNDAWRQMYVKVSNYLKIKYVKVTYKKGKTEKMEIFCTSNIRQNGVLPYPFETVGFANLHTNVGTSFPYALFFFFEKENFHFWNCHRQCPKITGQHGRWKSR